jgi:hypothetical protein
MAEQQQLASAGTFCPNKECHHYVRVDQGNIIKFGRSRQGVQRYRVVRAVKPPLAPRAELSFIESALR